MFIKKMFVYPRYPEELSKLFYLAYNLWSLWDDDAISLFYRVDTPLFTAVKRNPVELLLNVSEDRLNMLAKDKAFLSDLNRVWEKYKQYAEHDRLLSKDYKDNIIAYFSMEYGLHKSIPIYAGGLGILSGDHLKGASDLGIPIIGIGLFYKYGYFDQRINLNGMQEELFTEKNLYQMPIKDLKTISGKSIYITVNILGTGVKAKAWYINVGINKLILLDTNIDENPPEYRGITNYLYDANRDNRLKQEILLGIGGLRVLKELNIKADIYHMNEGHSALLILERLRKLIKEDGYSFEEARVIIKNSSVFTTHTPVSAGNENFPVEMIDRYLRKEIEELGISFDEFISYGLYGDNKTFWFPAFAIRFSRWINGVSKLHGEVSRKMWHGLFPGRLENEVPIFHITNGVHHSWLSSEMRYLFERYLGPDYIYTGSNKSLLRRILEMSEEEIWESHMKRKREMITFIRNVVKESYISKGYSVVKIKKVQEMLNVHNLIVGFARRFAGYKRPTLLLKDKERFKNILTNSARPIQFIFAGKAHPADLAGKNMIKEILDFAREYGVEDRVIFVENYNRSIAEKLVQGVDVWLNTPIKPLEASGTSGMKAGINGVLNLSVLDGWWPECYNKKNGWAVTAGDLYDNQEMRDLAEAHQIYDLLEHEISRLYYDRDERDIPMGWVQMMKESICTTYKDFDISRMLMDYNNKCYLSAIKEEDRLFENEKSLLKKVTEDGANLKKYWSGITIKEVNTDIDKKEMLFSGDEISACCLVALGDINPEIIRVDLCYYLDKRKELKIVPLKLKEITDSEVLYENSFKLESSGIQSINFRVVPDDENIRALYPELIKWKDS